MIVSLAVTGAGVAAGSVAHDFRRLAATSVAVSSDGTRYIAWQISQGRPIIVFDTRTRHHGQFAAPGCELDDQGELPGAGWHAADGRFLVVCARAAGLLDARTGKIVTLPQRPGGEIAWLYVGSRYVEGSDKKDQCRQSAREVKQGQYCVALYDIATGEVLADRPQSQVADLDRPGAPPICPRLRAKVLESRAGYSDGVFVEGTTPLRVYRCHGRPMLLHTRGEVRDVELRAGLLTWDSGHDPPEYGGPFGNGVGHGSLESYRLSTGRRRSFTLPRVAIRTGEQEQPVIDAVFGYSTHTTNTVFWIATRTLLFGEAGTVVGTSAIYTARL